MLYVFLCGDGQTQWKGRTVQKPNGGPGNISFLGGLFDPFQGLLKDILNVSKLTPYVQIKQSQIKKKER